jgi:hypothetical protein
VKNIDYIAIGISNDTGEFACACLKSWWNNFGLNTYSNSKAILITCDCGSSNGYRLRISKFDLPKLASTLNITVIVCHYPLSTTKWNKIEHALFSFISICWCAIPLTNIEMMKNLIINTTNSTGLKVYYKIDSLNCEKEVKISD